MIKKKDKRIKKKIKKAGNRIAIEASSLKIKRRNVKKITKIKKPIRTEGIIVKIPVPETKKADTNTTTTDINSFSPKLDPSSLPESFRVNKMPEIEPEVILCRTKGCREIALEGMDYCSFHARELRLI